MYFSKLKLDDDMSFSFLILLKIMFLKEDDIVDFDIKSWNLINSKESLEYKAIILANGKSIIKVSTTLQNMSCKKICGCILAFIKNFIREF